MKRASLVRAALCLGGASLLSVLHAREARACGGCFHGPPQPNEVESVITDHRMAFSISTTQTVLWDQVRYSGNPVEFAWVLPVHAGARLELSHDAWLAALDASTETIIVGPSLTCNGPGSFEQDGSGGGGCGFGASSAASLTAGSGGQDAGFAGTTQVQVVSEDVVGPYETVTLQSSNGNALNGWLTQNGFVIPAAVQPIIDAYVGQGFDFLALKLRPGQNVQAMQPVRIVTPGADPTLPLRMVAAGVGANVGLTLYVITEGRYHPQNFPDAFVDFSQLTWDPVQNRSNYEELAKATMQAGDGRGWITEFAGQPSLMRTGNVGGFAANGMPINPGLADAYESQCQYYPPLPACDAGTPAVDAGGGGDATTEASGRDAGGGDGDLAEAGDAATEAGPSEGGAVDAAPPPPPPVTCPQNPESSCEYFDDLTVALNGLHPENVWVTRLRAFPPASALNADLVLEPAPAQTLATSVHQTNKFSNPNFNPCGSGNNGASPSSSGGNAGGCTCGVAPRLRARFGQYLLLGLTMMGLGAMLRRRRAE